MSQNTPEIISQDAPESIVVRQVATRQVSIFSMLFRFAFHLTPRTIQAPMLSSDLPDQPFLVRAGELFHIYIADLETQVSPNGEIRGVFIVALRLVLLLLALAFVLLGVSAVTYVLVLITGHLMQMAEYLFWAMVYLVGAIVLGFVAFGLLMAGLVMIRSRSR